MYKVTVEMIQDNPRSDMIASWRYSSEIQADLDSARFVNSTEFISPGHSSEYTFDVVWTKSRGMVETSLDFSVSVGQSPQFGISESGLALIDLMSPNETGIHPITFLDDLPSVDRQDRPITYRFMAGCRFEQTKIGRISISRFFTNHPRT